LSGEEFTSRRFFVRRYAAEDRGYLWTGTWIREVATHSEAAMPECFMKLCQTLAVCVFLCFVPAILFGAESASDATAHQGQNQASTPMPQGTAMFLPAHEALLEKAKSGEIDVYFLGDSITRRWHGNDYPRFQENWKANFHGWNAANFGWGADSTQNALWRLQHGELDGVNPKVVVLLIGTNNVSGLSADAATDEDIADVAQGIASIVEVVRKKAPAAKLILTGITPRNENGEPKLMPIVDRINEKIAELADGESVVYLNINDKLADESGKLRPGVTEDGLHLSVAGYQIWADALKPYFTKWLGPPADVDRAPPPTGPPEVPPTPPKQR
jgi:lysophospholipase L1-like esterase